MNTFMQTLRSLGVVKLAATAGITLGVIMFLIFLTTRLSTPQMSLLFSDLEPGDSARIATQLETQNVPYEVSADGTRIMVPSDQAGRLRITLAEQGLTGNVIGWEIFDRDQTLGSSNFVQNINQLRALEGELARTIASLSPVKGARVHLVLPR
ncbi:MAG: flagellar M-ring protein FliF, partial [Alphaproteobacteria bacterium]